MKKCAKNRMARFRNMKIWSQTRTQRTFLLKKPNIKIKT